jgi:Fe2+ transport system protein FeoA
MSVADMPAASRRRIEGLEGPPEVVARLEALGLCAGRRVRLVRRGDTCILQVYGTRVGINAALAGHIYVSANDES